MDTTHQATGPPAHRTAAPSRVGSLGRDLTPLADIVDRLSTQFGPRLGLPVIISTVRRCRRELDIIHGPAPPELLERLARQRPHAITSTRANKQARRPP